MYCRSRPDGLAAGLERAPGDTATGTGKRRAGTHRLAGFSAHARPSASVPMLIRLIFRNGIQGRWQNMQASLRHVRRTTVPRRPVRFESNQSG
jgi:hypothetical protein